MESRRAIGLITSHTWGRFFDLVLAGIQTVARQHHVDVIALQMSPGDVARTAIARDLVDGWLLLSFTTGIEHLQAQQKPIVTISTRVPGFAAVMPDNHQGITTIMQHLFAGGHRQIAFIGDTKVGDIQERYDSYCANLAQQGIAFDPALAIISDDPLRESGARAVQQLIASEKDFSAIVVGNDP